MLYRQQVEEYVPDNQRFGVNRESIRPKIYEGIGKGFSECISNGLYTITRKDVYECENTHLHINGTARDLSMFPDNSLDAIITVIYINLPSRISTQVSSEGKGA